MKNILLVSFLSFFSVYINAQCKTIYVTPSGSGTGTKASPSSLSNAINTLATNGDHIKVSQGTYIISNPFTTIPDSLIIEGGYVPTMSWDKTSQAGGTIIYRDDQNVQDIGTDSARLSAFEIANSNGFRLQDLTIEVDSAPNSVDFGISTYGIHLNNCVNYAIVRCQVIVGSASDGASGIDGAIGANGSPGLDGQVGDNDEQNQPCRGGAGGAGAGGGVGAAGIGGNSDGGNGTSGNSATSYRSGGSGGGGGGGGQEKTDGGRGGNGGGVMAGVGCATQPTIPANSVGGVGGQEDACNSGSATGCVVGISGTDGADGADGVDGCNGAVGAMGTKSVFWRTANVAPDGTDGQGGAGGKGGGGGAGEGGTFCIDGSGSGGGGGGGGAEGGEKGTGAYGGGSSYGIFIVNNGANGVVGQSNLIAGNPGNGGTGGLGAAGGTGAMGGAALVDGSSDFYEVGCGGFGGDGGDGGKGGDGGNGSNGESLNIYVNGTPLASQDVAFDLSVQPVISVAESFCAGEKIVFTAATSGVWDFGSSSPEGTLTGASVSTSFLYAGRKDIKYGVNTYQGFSSISNYSPDVARAGNDTAVCGPINLYADTLVNGNGLWTTLSTGTSVANPTDPLSVVTLIPGENILVWSVSLGACCPTTYDTVSISLKSTSPSSILVSSASDTLCRNDSVTLSINGGNLVGNDQWYWYEASCGGILIDSGTSIKVAPQTNTAYFVGPSGGSCNDTACVTKIIYVKGAFVNLIPFDTICGVLQPIQLAQGVPSGGTYAGTGVNGRLFDPVIADFGTHEITYNYVDPGTGCNQFAKADLVVSSACADIDLVLVINTFSPNGDGRNDTWNLNLGNYSKSTVMVFNKWGNKVFESNERIIQWDGKSLNGADLPSGSYFYVLTVEDELRKGTITIVR